MKMIKNDNDYQEALKRAEELIDMDPDPGTPAADELEVLTFLIETWEEKHFPVELPDPIDAIKFRMQQQGLVQKDLVPYIGSSSKVSEVLNRRRPLSLNMIRNLHRELGIPAEVLLQEKSPDYIQDDSELDWQKFPIHELIKKGWISFTGSAREAKTHAEELMRGFFSDVSLEHIQTALCRQSIRTEYPLDDYALIAWKGQVLKVAKKQSCENHYEKGTVNKGFISDLLALSLLEKGPQLCRDYLSTFGIRLVFMPHLNKTRLDGAVLLDENGEPVIALTLRYARIDHFWFTLVHELAHIHLHLDRDDITCFVDEIGTQGNALEREADRYAQNAMIPENKWRALSGQLTDKNIRTKALQLRLHPAIVAGRFRYETNQFNAFAQVIDSLDRDRLYALN
jgi:HTH-type transcriptional regulator / antitoxin HigA